MAFTPASKLRRTTQLTRRHAIIRSVKRAAALICTVALALILVAVTTAIMAQQRVELVVDVSKPGARIGRNIFGQFAEHLGHGVYEGIWVGPDSPIRNTRGIRNDVVMKAWQNHQWSWDMQGLSMHNYTVVNWGNKLASMGFGETEYSTVLKSTLKMEDLINKHTAIMDKYDPQKKIALVVDEWGAWYAPLPGSNPGFLIQQNSQRDAILTALNLNIFARHADRVRMANIAQMINVLQAMIMTDKEKMVLTPTYYVYKMYVPFQNATAGTYTNGNVTLPRVDAIAAKDAAGNLWLEVTNVDPNQPVEIELSLPGSTPKSAKGETLTAPKVDSVNTFDAPNTVAPKPISANAQGGKLVLKLAPKPVTVMRVGQ